MKNIEQYLQNYLDYCTWQKRLNAKTIKAYRIDLTQFVNHISTTRLIDIYPEMLESYISNLHKNYHSKTVKRKIASIKAAFHYFEYKGLIDSNPFNKLRIRFREPLILPKTIPLNIVEALLKTIYCRQSGAKTAFQRNAAVRDAAICELLFATGIRISELCSLRAKDINLQDGTILIYGKGSKERRLQVANTDVIIALKKYNAIFSPEEAEGDIFFINQSGRPLSDQSVRRMINKYTSLAKINMHITPHMFRHTFATSLLDAGVDIRYIQEMLGHSSINITEIYTHVALSKQRDILISKHPRKNFNIP